MKRIAWGFAFLAVAFLGLLLGASYGRASSQLVIQKVSGIHPERDVAATDFKPFAVVVYAHDDALWCERTLRSLFEQDYEHMRFVVIDDASRDGTWEKLQQVVAEGGQEHRTILVHHETHQGESTALARAAEQCLDREVLVPLSAHDWLTKPNVLSALNLGLQNPDVWMVSAGALKYPAYEEVEDGLWAFYAALLRRVPQENREACVASMQELAGGRMRQVSEPLVFLNEAVVRNEPSEKLVVHSDPLEYFP